MRAFRSTAFRMHGKSKMTSSSTFFYRPEEGHGLPYNPFSAIVTPRPIGWISSQDSAGKRNLAPYSFFNAVAYTPPQVMFSSTGTKTDQDGTKDSVSNIRETGVFCVNIVEFAMKEAMNQTSAGFAKEQDEFVEAGVEAVACESIAGFRVAGAPASLECKLIQIVQLPGEANFAVFGEVIGVHMREDCVVDGRFDVTKFRPVARLGYKDYVVVNKDNMFSLSRPDAA